MCLLHSVKTGGLQLRLCVHLTGIKTSSPQASDFAVPTPPHAERLARPASAGALTLTGCIASNVSLSSDRSGQYRAPASACTGLRYLRRLLPCGVMSK